MRRDPCATGSPGEPQVALFTLYALYALFAFFLPDSAFSPLSPCSETLARASRLRLHGLCTIGVKPKTDAAAMPRTETRTSLSRPTTPSPPVDGQSVCAKSPSLVKYSEVSQDLAKLTSTTNGPSPLSSTLTTTATLSTTSSPDEYAIEEDNESLDEFKDSGDTHEPKLEAFPRIKPTCARPISLLAELIRNNTPHVTGSCDGSEKTRTSKTSGKKSLSRVEAAALDAEENGKVLAKQILLYKSISQLSTRRYCPDLGHGRLAPEMIEAMASTVGDGTSVLVYHRRMAKHRHDEDESYENANLIS